jgi:hypothetical protein
VTDSFAASDNVPTALVQQVREHIELRKRFEAAADTICNINLRRFLKQKEKPNLAPNQFETYLDKVFDFSARVQALPEGRRFPQHSGKKIFDAVFLVAACQFPALQRNGMPARCSWPTHWGFETDRRCPRRDRNLQFLCALL